MAAPNAETAMPRTILLYPVLAVTLAGCAGMMGGPTATATLSPTTGSNTTGSVKFVQRVPQCGQEVVGLVRLGHPLAFLSLGVSPVLAGREHPRQ